MERIVLDLARSLRDVVRPERDDAATTALPAKVPAEVDARDRPASRNFRLTPIVPPTTCSSP